MLQRVVTDGFTSSCEQRREEIVNAIHAEMDKTFTRRRKIKDLIRELGDRGSPTIKIISGACARSARVDQPADLSSVSTSGAAQPADTERRLVPCPPRTPPPDYLLDDAVSNVKGFVEAQRSGLVHGHGSETSASTGGAPQPAHAGRRLLPHPPRMPPPSYLFDNPAFDVHGLSEGQGRGFVHDHGKAYGVIGLRELERQ